MVEALNPTELLAWILAIACAAFSAWAWQRVRALEAELQNSRLRAESNADAARKALEDRDASLARVRRQSDEDRRFAHEPLVRELIPALDGFEHALAAAGERDDAVLVGVRMVQAQMLQALNRHGVKVVTPESSFDPSLHEAIEVRESANHCAGAILSTWGRGYVLHERVLRPARVVVASEPSPAPEPPDETSPDPADEADRPTEEPVG